MSRVSRGSEVVKGVFPSIPIRKVAGCSTLHLQGPLSAESGGTAQLKETSGHIRARGESVSLYPSGQGVPICDSWEVRGLGEQGECCFALADGCGWGEKKRVAARKACDGLLSHLMEHFASCRSTTDVASLLQKGLAAAHENIVKGHEEIWDAGTCSLGGGVVFLTDDNSYCCCVVVVGSVHIFTQSKAFGVRQITDQAIPSPSDPGGRVGPYIDAGDPDLRNMQKYLCSDLRDGDGILLVSDSVVRNMDVLGSLPQLPDVTKAATYAIRCIEKSTKELKDFMTENTTVKTAPPHIRGALDHASALGVLVGRPPLLGMYEWVGESALDNVGMRLEGGNVIEWNRIFVCVPPYGGNIALEVKDRQLRLSVIDYQNSPLNPGIMRYRELGQISLLESTSKKQLGRWLKSLFANDSGEKEKAAQFSESLMKELRPDRDVLQVIAKGVQVQENGLYIHDVVLQIYGRENTQLSTRRLVFARCEDANKLLDKVREDLLPSGLTTLPPFSQWLQSFLVPAADKY